MKKSISLVMPRFPQANDILLYMLVFSLPLTAFSIFPWFGFQLSYAISMALGFLILIKGLLKGHLSVKWSPVNKAVLMFWGAAFLSVIGVFMTPYGEFAGETPQMKFTSSITKCNT